MISEKVWRTCCDVTEPREEDRVESRVSVREKSVEGRDRYRVRLCVTDVRLREREEEVVRYDTELQGALM